MTVHVGELHTEVVPGSTAGQPGPPAEPPKRLGAPQEQWRQLRWEDRRDCCRTASEGFDD